MRKPLLPEMALAIATAFPELGGRSIAVSEVDPFKQTTHVPTLPLAVCALVTEQAVQAASGGGAVQLTDDVLIQLMFEPVKYKLKGSEDSPFFAFYDYEAIRDRMLGLFHSWRTPNNGGLSYKSLAVESDEFAVYLAFRFSVSEKWCAPEQDAGHTVQIMHALTQPRVDLCAPVEEKEDACT